MKREENRRDKIYKYYYAGDDEGGDDRYHYHLSNLTK